MIPIKFETLKPSIVRVHPLFSFVNAPVTRSEISEVIKLLKDKKTQDFFGLMNFIKSISDQLLIPLHHIINLSLESSVVPNQMKIAKVIPLFKSGDPLSLDNYRPISLLILFRRFWKKLSPTGSVVILNCTTYCLIPNLALDLGIPQFIP